MSVSRAFNGCRSLANALRGLTITQSSNCNSFHTSTINYEWNVYHLCKPDPLYHKFRRKVYFPDEYTVEPLRNDHLAGRDPNTGRVVTAKIGGGIKHKFHWVDMKRVGPETPDEFFVEKVIQIMTCGCRSAHIALVGGENHLRYILATVNMKAGDIIRTSQYIPLNPYMANEGDAFPLGSLSDGTKVHNIEKLPGRGGKFLHAAGAQGSIVRKINRRVIVKFPSKQEVSFPEKCMAVVGQVSNPQHSSIPYGSPNALRRAGRRPRSGLFQKKTGRFGRKIKPPPPVLVMKPKSRPTEENIRIIVPNRHIKYPKGYV